MQENKDSYRISGHHSGLDGIRGIAIIGVMAVHFLVTMSPQNVVERAISKLAGYGEHGVDLFFVLSGFLITGILLDTKNTPGFFRNFYMRRTLRIFPLYFGVLILLFGLLPLLMNMGELLESAQTHQVWLWTYTSNFFIAKTGTWSLGPLSHFWSLAIEEHFYLVWPFVVFAVPKNHLKKVCISVFVLSLVLRMFLVFRGMNLVSINVLTPCRIDAMCIGGLFASLIRDETFSKSVFQKITVRAMYMAIAIVAISIVLLTTEGADGYIQQIRSSLIILFFAQITLMGIRQPSRPAIAGIILENRVFRFLGKYSYGLYVYHGILTWYIGDNISEYLGSILGHSTAGFLAKAIIATAISIVIAIISYELFEKSFLNLKRFFETQKTPSNISS